MSLYQRITAQDATKVHSHDLAAALRLWAGGWNGIDMATIVAAFNLAGSDVTDLQALRDRYVAMPQNNVSAAIAKSAWLTYVEGVFMLWESGLLTEAQGKNALGV